MKTSIWTFWSQYKWILSFFVVPEESVKTQRSRRLPGNFVRAKTVADVVIVIALFVFGGDSNSPLSSLEISYNWSLGYCRHIFINSWLKNSDSDSNGLLCSFNTIIPFFILKRPLLRQSSQAAEGKSDCDVDANMTICHPPSTNMQTRRVFLS